MQYIIAIITCELAESPPFRFRESSLPIGPKVFNPRYAAVFSPVFNSTLENT
jgi:hypothetical protein